MRRILLLTDLSKRSLKGIHYGIQLYQESNYPEPTQFVIFHSYHHVIPVALSDGPIVAEQFTQEMQVARELFDRIVDEVQADYPQTIEKVFAQGPLTASLNAHYMDQPFDVVVMNSQQKTKVGRWIMGSNAQDLVWASPCTLLIVPPSLEYKKPKKLMLATDFKNLEDLNILKPLSDLQEANKAEVLMLHVYDPDKSDPNEMTAHQRRLEQYFENRAFRHFFLEHDDPAEGIEEFISGYSADVLVLVSQERKLLQRVFHKSVSKQLLMHAGVPILVVKSSASDDEAVEEQEAKSQRNQVQKWRTQIDAMGVQWNLGKKELADEMDQTRDNAGKQWQKVRHRLDGFSEMSADRWDHFKSEMQESIKHLAHAFGIGTSK